MKTFILLAVLFAGVLNAYSQHFLTRKKESVKKRLTHFYLQENLIPVFSETDSSLTVKIKDSTGVIMKGEFSYFFKRNGRCYKETGTGDCKKCFDEIVNGAKSQKRFQWKKIHDNFYLSKPFWQVAIITSKEGTAFSYSIIYRHLKREEHARLYKAH